jgi:hypothetical protein
MKPLSTDKNDRRLCISRDLEKCLNEPLTITHLKNAVLLMGTAGL